jgi:prepilin-type N-terminal cleavage/methylation domain-containing protein
MRRFVYSGTRIAQQGFMISSHSGEFRRLQPASGISAGVTLLEVLVVILIVGIAMSVGLPKYRDYYLSQSLLGLQTAVMTKFREAPPLSKALRKEVIVAVDLSNEQVWLELDGNQYGAKAPTNVGTADIKAIADATTPMTTGIARYKFSYWNTVTDTATAGHSLTIHMGLVSTTYNSAALNTEFRTITLMGETGRAYGYNVGCFGTNPWGSWPSCPEVL